MTSSADRPGKPAIGALPWQQVGTCGLGELTKARSETINLIQWLARVANSYVRNGTPERRTELEFVAAESAFVTKPFDEDISLELRLPSLEMQFLEHGKPVPHILDPQEHSPAEVEAWILVELLHRGIDRERFSKRLPYAMADLMSGDAQEHSPQSCRRGLVELAAWFKNAAALLDAAARAGGAGEGCIVCLPQSLTLTCVSGRGGQHADFGFVPGDGTDPEPFFYVFRDGPARRKRAVLNASKLFAESDPAAAAMTFLISAAG
jgi:hypothetical protein